MPVLRAWAWVVLAVACAPTPPERPPGVEVRITTEPPASLEALPAVVRFRVSGLTLPAAGVLLFEGALSAYHEGRIRNADLPSTLAERRFLSTAFETEEGDIVVAPSRKLRAGATYTLAALGRGTLATAVVASMDDVPYAERIFPRGAAAGGARWVFCGAPLDAGRKVLLEPGNLSAVVAPGAVGGLRASGNSRDSAACFHVDVDDAPDTGFVIPPPRVGDVALEPSPVSFQGATSVVVPPACKAVESALEPGCVTVQDDRIVVRSAAAPLVWALRVNGAAESVNAPPPSGRFVVTGLAPEADVHVEGVVADASGREALVDTHVTTLPAMPHVVVNEVLANPNGPEPAQEWVELVNDGGFPVSLGGFTLGDADAESELPDVILEPGAFAVVVAEAFDVGGHLDPSIHEGTLIVRVPRLGQSGLSNSGERVTLRSPTGQVISSFPPIAPTSSGVSVARKASWGLDDDTSGFAPSVGAGASPGAPNVTSGDR